MTSKPPTRRGRTIAGWSLAVALVIVIVALVVSARTLAVVFLVAYTAVLSVVLGTLALTLIAHLTTATWFRPFRARAEVVVRTLPILAAIGILILVAIPLLFPWFGANDPAHAYLNAPFFIVRWIIYWIAWIGIESGLHSARRLERAGDRIAAARRFRIVASAGLVVLGITMTFAAFDWLMSLTPDWASTVYGIYWFAGGLVGAFSLLALSAAFDDAWSLEQVSTDDVHSLGKLLTMAVLFWVYIGFSQYIVIWSGGLPSETPWYVARSRGGWGGVAGVLLFVNFLFPFLLLLVRAVKRSRSALAFIGGTLLAMHYLDTFWVAVPGVAAVTWWTIVVAVAALVALVGAVAVSTRALAARSRALDVRGSRTEVIARP